jgi:hypothetical protein
MNEEVEVAIRDLVHEFGMDWDLTTEQEEDLEKRIKTLIKKTRKMAP